MLFTVQIATPIPKAIEKVDITAKSSPERWKIFAPTWGMVNEFKSGRLSKEQYRIMYFSLMRLRYKENRAIFQELIEKSLNDNIALACYCKAGDFCHRYLLVDILSKIEPQIQYQGEIVNTPSAEQPVLNFHS